MSEATVPAEDGAETPGAAREDDHSSETAGTDADAEATADRPAGDPHTVTKVTDHWQAGLLLALAAACAGFALENTALFLSAVVGLVYSGYTSLSAPPEAPLLVERTVRPQSPAPGDRLSVTLTVENVSRGALADVRITDRPPADLPVLDGDARAADALEPGETMTIEYDLRARRGAYAFDDPVSVVRTVSGGAGRGTVHDLADEVRCYAPFDAMDLAPQTGRGQGQVETDSGGEGIEFHATRQHHPSDPVRHIDWNRYASTGDLRTVTYRESKAATVVLLVDGRHDVRRRADQPDATELAGYAAVRITDALLDDHNSVGAVVASGDGTRRDDVGISAHCRPDRGREQGIRVRSLLAWALDVRVGDVADGRGGAGGSDGASRRSGTDVSTPFDDARRTPVSGNEVDWLRDWIDDHAQVVVVSPLLDDAIPVLVTLL